MSAEKLIICPKCAEPSLKRLMSSGVGLFFKGSGFYLTDYKKTSSSISSKSTKSESKVETKSGLRLGEMSCKIGSNRNIIGREMDSSCPTVL